jgi:hypothetical protein
MSLSPGVRVWPYEIVALLGSGGPAFARVDDQRELRRGLAVAKEARA